MSPKVERRFEFPQSWFSVARRVALLVKVFPNYQQKILCRESLSNSNLVSSGSVLQARVIALDLEAALLILKCCDPGKHPLHLSLPVSLCRISVCG
jgi:hypothetical protein